AALAQVGLALGTMTRPTRALFGGAIVLNLVIAGFWAATTSHGVSWATAGIGISLSALVVFVTALLAWRPTMGRTWSSGTSVIGSVVPAAVVIIAVAAVFTPGVSGGPPTATASASASGKGSGGSGVDASTALALATTVKVPGETSKTFASTLAGNETEKAENA